MNDVLAIIADSRRAFVDIDMEAGRNKIIRAPWSESLSLNNEVNNCPSVRPCVSFAPPTNYHENSI